MSLDPNAELAHCRRTAALAVELGRRAGVATEPLEQAALLHHALDPLRHCGALGRLAWHVVGGDDRQRIAEIVQVCNLVDERVEALEFEHEELDTILDEIQGFAAFEGFDPALVQYFREMRSRTLPHGLKLPVEARAAGHVVRQLQAEGQYEISDLEALALHDPVLTGSLLAVANSALHGRSRRVSTVSRAIAAIGVIAARKVMLAAAMRPLFASAGLERIWSHSLSSAPLCSALACHTGLLTHEEGLVLGLVHDIGSVALQFLPRETIATHRNLIEGGCPAAYVERIILGCDHGEIGARLIAEWCFPAEFIEAVRFHHQPERSESKLASLAYLAEFWSGLDEDLPSFGRVDMCLARIDLTLETLMELSGQDRTLRTLQAVA